MDAAAVTPPITALTEGLAEAPLTFRVMPTTFFLLKLNMNTFVVLLMALAGVEIKDF